MLSKKKYIFPLSLGICVCYIAKLSDGMFDKLYEGIDFQGMIFSYGFQFWMISILSAMVSMKYSAYLEQYAPSLVLRNRNRCCMYYFFQKSLIKDVFLFELGKVGLYTLAVLLFYNKIYIHDFIPCLTHMLIYILMEIMLMSILMFIEIFYNAKAAWILVLSYFLISLRFGDILMLSKLPDYLQLIWMPSTAMGYRLRQLDISGCIVIVIELIMIFLLYKLGQRKMRKMDIL